MNLIVFITSACTKNRKTDASGYFQSIILHEQYSHLRRVSKPPSNISKVDLSMFRQIPAVIFSPFPTSTRISNRSVNVQTTSKTSAYQYSGSILRLIICTAGCLCIIAFFICWFRFGFIILHDLIVYQPPQNAPPGLLRGISDHSLKGLGIATCILALVVGLLILDSILWAIFKACSGRTERNTGSSK